MYEKIEKHESYAMCAISRTNSSHGIPLFGSNLKHANTIRLTISRAEVDRHLNQNWYHPKEELIEIEMSPIQFSELITNMNTSGVPVTLNHVNRKRMENPPFESIVEKHDKEFKGKMDKIGEDIKENISKAISILNSKGTPKRAEKDFISDVLNDLARVFKDNIPFAKEQFTKVIDKTVSEAKSAIEAHHTHKIVSLGMEAYAKELNISQDRLIDMIEEDNNEQTK